MSLTMQDIASTKLQKRKSQPRHAGAGSPLLLKTKSGVPLQRIRPIWKDRAVIVAATGPSLTPEVADHCRVGHPVIAVNDAYRLFPGADMLYACDAAWWSVHNGCPDFAGERWSSHGALGRVRSDDKSEAGARYGLNLVAGMHEIGFSLDPDCIHYGSNSGFQAINIAILAGASVIILVGFNMQAVGNRRHFFGDHPAGLRNSCNYQGFVRAFERAQKRLPPGIKILNATPKSALTCFEKVDIKDALETYPA